MPYLRLDPTILGRYLSAGFHPLGSVFKFVGTNPGNVEWIYLRVLDRPATIYDESLRSALLGQSPFGFTSNWGQTLVQKCRRCRSQSHILAEPLCGSCLEPLRAEWARRGLLLEWKSVMAEWSEREPGSYEGYAQSLREQNGGTLEPLTRLLTHDEALFWAHNLVSGSPLPPPLDARFDDGSQELLQLRYGAFPVAGQAADAMDTVLETGDDEDFDYHRYLASRDWALLKRKVRERSRGICERCGARPYEETHHLTYARIGTELLEDLQALCKPCHRYISAVTDNDPLDSSAFASADTAPVELDFE